MKSEHWLAAAGVFLLILLLWTIGLLVYEWPPALLIAGTIGILLLWIVVVVVLKVTASRRAARLEKSLRQQAEAQLVGARPEKREEIEQVRDQFERAVDALKKSKLGKGSFGQNALYALPWYMLIGPPAAGKTTAISNSGLEFPFGSNRIRGVGGTRHCDWFFSNSAIFLDTAGRYTMESEDREEWLGFLDLLKKHRGRRPINGMIVCVDIVDIADASPDEVEYQAMQIRSRIDEIIGRLHVRFPVYLVFTKCDLVQGFVETFEDLSRKERDQIWGATFDLRQTAPGGPQEAFEAEYDRLTAAVSDFRLGQLSSPMKRERRHKTYVFPIELASLRSKLGAFVGRLFLSSPYQENPIFRGFYLTSGTQEGVPIDRVIQAVARQFDLPPAVVGQDAEVERKSYFIKDIFTEVIVPDQHLVSLTSKGALKGNLVRSGAYVGAAAVLGLFLLGTSQGFVRSRQDLSQLRSAADSMRFVNWDGRVQPEQNFRRMDRLRTAIDEAERQSAFTTVGLKRSGDAAEAARTLYFRKAADFVDRFLYRELEGRLVQYSVNPSAEFDGIYNTLKAYLLMGDEVGRLDQTEREFLRETLRELLFARFPVHFWSERDRAELQPLLERQVTFYADNLGLEGTGAFETDQDLVHRVRARIGPTTAQSLYDRIRDDGLRALPDRRLEDMVPGLDLAIFVDSASVPGFFTRNGWNGAVKDAIAEVSKNPGATDWVIGTEQGDLPEEMRDADLLSAALETLYFQDYADAWMQFVRSIHYAPNLNLSEAADRLTRLGGTANSPLVLILKEVRQQTKYDDVLAQAAEARARKLGGRLTQRLGLKPGTIQMPQRDVDPLQSQFAPFHNLFDENGAPSPDLKNVLDQYAVAAVAISTAEQDEQAAAALADPRNGPLSQALKAVKLSLRSIEPSLKAQLFEKPLEVAVDVAVNGAGGVVNNNWRTAVYDVYQEKLASFYPFNPEGPDAPRAIVEEFFHPETGVFTAFFKEQIQPRITPDWKPKTSTVNMSPAALEQVRRLRMIQQALFPYGQFQQRFYLTALQPEGRGAGQVVMKIDGQEDTYNMGQPAEKQFSWPGPASPGAYLQIRTQSGWLPAIQQNGEWGWIRLLEEAQIRRVSPTQYQLRWTFPRETDPLIVIYNMRLEHPQSPLANPRELFRVRLPASLAG